MFRLRDDARPAEYDQFGRKNDSNFLPVTANAV